MSGSLWKASSRGDTTGTGSGGLASAAGLSFFHGGGSAGAGISLTSGASAMRESKPDSPPLTRGLAAMTGAGSGFLSLATGGELGVEAGCAATGSALIGAAA